MNAEKQELDHATLDPGGVRFRSIDALKFSLRETNGSAWYLVEDMRTGRFFRLGVEEASLLSLFNGRVTLSEAISHHSQQFPEAKLSEESAVEICNYLLESELISTYASRSTTRIETKKSKSNKSSFYRWLNPVSIAIPLCNPDRFFTLLHRWTAWVPSKIAFLVLSILIALGSILFLQNWDLVTIQRLQTFSSVDWLWMVSGWIVVKVFHELGHGIVCKRLGGTVTQFGIVLFLFIPLPFVNCTSAWGFGRRRDRIAVAAAGLLLELSIASIAMLVWRELEPGGARFHLENIILATMVHSLLFNLNPLMKFDGYYILSDLMDLPNLSQQGRRFVDAWLRKIFIDAGTQIPVIERYGWFVALYGVLSRVWMLTLFVTIIFAACNFGSGTGLVLGLLAALACFIPALKRLLSSLFVHGQWRGSRIKRLVSMVLLIGGMSSLAMMAVPSPRYVSAPAVFAFEEQRQVRVQIEGFLQAIHVDSGAEVQKGDLLAVIHKPELETEILQLRTDLTSEEIRLRAYRHDGDVAKELVSKKQIESLVDKIFQLEELQSKRLIYAPIDGVVITPELQGKLNSYLVLGSEILTIAKKESLFVSTMVNQKDVARLRTANGGGSARVFVPGVKSQFISCSMKEIAPRATTLIHHRALAAPFGGPLEVVKVQDSGETTARLVGGMDKEVLDLTNEQFERGMHLTVPHVELKLQLEHHSSEFPPPSGVVGVAHIPVKNASLGNYVFAEIRSWFSSRLDVSHGF